VTLVSGINFLNQAFHLATHALAGFPKLHHKCSAHSEFRIWLVSASARGYSVEFTWILCRRWKTDAVARTVNGSGNRGPLSVGAAEEQRRKSVHAVLGLRCGETISFPRTCSSGRELSVPELFPETLCLMFLRSSPAGFVGYIKKGPGPPIALKAIPHSPHT
jgi:hypothetical protein